jgi:hypothetical protein
MVVEDVRGCVIVGGNTKRREDELREEWEDGGERKGEKRAEF